jgi:hypothetical protein
MQMKDMKFCNDLLSLEMIGDFHFISFSHPHLFVFSISPPFQENKRKRKKQFSVE